MRAQTRNAWSGTEGKTGQTAAAPRFVGAVRHCGAPRNTRRTAPEHDYCRGERYSSGFGRIRHNKRNAWTHKRVEYKRASSFDADVRPLHHVHPEGKPTPQRVSEKRQPQRRRQDNKAGTAANGRGARGSTKSNTEAPCGDRAHDRTLTKRMLYQLS